MEPLGIERYRAGAKEIGIAIAGAIRVFDKVIEHPIQGVIGIPIVWVCLSISVAAFLGGEVGYLIGHKAGPRILPYWMSCGTMRLTVSTGTAKPMPFDPPDGL